MSDSGPDPKPADDPGATPGQQGSQARGQDSDPQAGNGHPSYEQAREELGDIVRRLESGGGGLEESLALWERGEYLIGVCQRWLDGARARLAARSGTD